MKVTILKLNDKTMGVFVNHYDVIDTLMATYTKSVSSISGRGEGKLEVIGDGKVLATYTTEEHEILTRPTHL
jgi:hypothetical protein